MKTVFEVLRWAWREDKHAFWPVVSMWIVVVFICLVALARGEALRTTNIIWDEVQFATRIADTDPIFSDTTTVQATLIKDAFGWLQNNMYGYAYFDIYLMQLSKVDLSYEPLPATSYYYHLPTRIKGVMHFATDTAEALSSVDISDMSKRFDNNAILPNFYAWDKDNEIWFNSYSADTCSVYVWSYRYANTDSACAWGKKPPVTAPLSHILDMKVIANAKAKERNLVAHSNVNQIAQAMLADALQIYQMVEQTKDIVVPPLIYEE